MITSKIGVQFTIETQPSKHAIEFLEKYGWKYEVDTSRDPDVDFYIYMPGAKFLINVIVTSEELDDMLEELASINQNLQNDENLSKLIIERL